MIVCMNYEMLEYDRIDISEGIDINKTSASKECEREYGRNRYHDMSEEKNQRIKNIKTIIVKLKSIFHRCRYGNKDAFQNCY